MKVLAVLVHLVASRGPSSRTAVMARNLLTVLCLGSRGPNHAKEDRVLQGRVDEQPSTSSIVGPDRRARLMNSHVAAQRRSAPALLLEWGKPARRAAAELDSASPAAAV